VPAEGSFTLKKLTLGYVLEHGA